MAEYFKDNRRIKHMADDLIWSSELFKDKINLKDKKLLCSVLVPSRARPDRLHTTIESVWNTAVKPERVEIRIKFDDDDEISLNRIEEFKKIPRVHVMVAPRERGWYSLSKYYTLMANESPAAWIWAMNDDAMIEGTEWDDQLATIPTHGWIVQQEWYKWGPSRYMFASPGAFPIFPNGSWQKCGEQQIGGTLDIDIDKLLRIQNGWKVVFLKGIGVFHDRDNDEEIKKHRSLLP